MIQGTNVYFSTGTIFFYFFYSRSISAEWYKRSSGPYPDWDKMGVTERQFWNTGVWGHASHEILKKTRHFWKMQGGGVQTPPPPGYGPAAPKIWNQTLYCVQCFPYFTWSLSHNNDGKFVELRTYLTSCVCWKELSSLHYELQFCDFYFDAQINTVKYLFLCDTMLAFRDYAWPSQQRTGQPSELNVYTVEHQQAVFVCTALSLGINAVTLHNKHKAYFCHNYWSTNTQNIIPVLYDKVIIIAKNFEQTSDRLSTSDFQLQTSNLGR